MFLHSRRFAAAVLAPACLIVVSALPGRWLHCEAAEQPPSKTLSGWTFDPENDCPTGTTVPRGHTFLQFDDCEEERLCDRIKSVRRRVSWKKSMSHCGRMYGDNPPYYLPNFGYYETHWRPAFVLCNEPGGRFIDESEQFETPPMKVPTPAPSPEEYSPPTDAPAQPASIPGGHSTAE